jgi:hypothetical protein
MRTIRTAAACCLSSAEHGPLADRPGAALLEPDLYNRLPTGH